jgi:hypothetical protein
MPFKDLEKKNNIMQNIVKKIVIKLMQDLENGIKIIQNIKKK